MKLTGHFGFRYLLYLCGASITLGLVLALTHRVVTSPGFWDFNVFYSSAKTALQGMNYYRTFGAERLPYWYFPWLAWYFIPFAFLPYATAKVVFTVLTLACAGAVIRLLGTYFNPRLSLALQLFIAGMCLLMSMLLFMAGQMDFLLVAVITAVILLLDRRKPIVAGLLVPVLLFKPHLLAVFLPFLFLRGGRAFRWAALASLVLLSAVAFILIPNWPSEMVRMLTEYGSRDDNYWNFITLPQLLGSQENWSGTANLPVSIGLLVLGLLVAWRFRRLPLVPLLSLTLAASMLCAPRAYTYNLPILIPPMLWISANRPVWGTLLWLGAGLTASWAAWSTGAYIIVVLVFVLAVFKAIRIGGAEATTKGVDP